MLTKAPRGTRDILPGEVERWLLLEDIARNLCCLYNYREIRTPIFEHTELFQRSVGEDTDIVAKEMYSFKDRSDRSLTLRPENTASVVRAYLENKLFGLPQPVKLYYIGPMFRYDRPQAGRYRQFHQFGVEAFGSLAPALDAEIISLAYEFYRRLGLNNIVLELNSIGCENCRPRYRDLLKNFLETRKEKLCRDCRNRFINNPLRVLDCKEAGCRSLLTGIPKIVTSLCPECAAHFSSLKEELTNMDIPYKINPFLVRGLDYYTKTVFEFTGESLGAQNSLGGGGRYDGLVELCGGQPTPGIGFALGIERILLACKGEKFKINPSLQVYVAVIDREADKIAGRLVKELRGMGISCDRDYLDRSLKAQLKQAGRLNAGLVVILGGREMQEGKGIIRQMDSGKQETYPLAGMAEYIWKTREQEDSTK
ncbi:MAG TPA: histidine--tRNA ligase [Firmicutes bacterium]|nr:histidine--tRNA ligase [Bacillota bacterium]